MSMVSAVEILYYFSIILNKYYRQECNARKKLFEQKIQKESEENMKMEQEANAKDEKENTTKNMEKLEDI